MKTKVKLVLTPGELETLRASDLAGATCVVFDVLRATSTIATALHHGAREIVVVDEIQEALALRAAAPRILLAGERGGKRISASLTGSIDFDLGNSPREFTTERVNRRAIVMTTTNGTRALNGCRGASTILAASFLNLTATAKALLTLESERIMMVCAGTGNDFSLEDALGAGALLSLLPDERFDTSPDSCTMAMQLYGSASADLENALANSVNGRSCPRLRNCAAISRSVHSRMPFRNPCSCKTTLPEFRQGPESRGRRRKLLVTTIGECHIAR